MNNRFHKKERICLKRDIDELFARGDSFFCFPFRCVRLLCDDSCDRAPVSLLVSVSKRYSKLAVRRNLIKRRTREAFRLAKGRCVPCDGRRAMLALIYVSKKEESYETIAKSVGKILSETASLLSVSGDNA